MPKPTTITKDMIIEAAFEIVRKGGLKMLSARNVAKNIGCSTQPIYWTYKNMDMLKKDVIVKMETLLCSKILSYKKHECSTLNTLMGYISLAHKEPMLFREFYINNVKKTDIANLIPSGLLNNEILKENQSPHPLIKKWILGHGVASLIASGALTYNESILEKEIDKAFE